MNETTTRENMMRAMIATKQLEIDRLKRKIKEMEDANNARQRSNTSRKETVRTTEGSVSDK